ncbi:MAG: hypothetical protein U5K74_04340 [Gemmatimonadaceae bacterium]|nr:hypothetical protein [Gemmatimonadaceae bacterium]
MMLGRLRRYVPLMCRQSSDHSIPTCALAAHGRRATPCAGGPDLRRPAHTHRIERRKTIAEQLLRTGRDQRGMDIVAVMNIEAEMGIAGQRVGREHRHHAAFDAR